MLLLVILLVSIIACIFVACNNDDEDDDLEWWEELLLVVGIIGFIALVVGLFANSIVANVIIGVIEVIVSITSGIVMRLAGISFGFPWWGCVLSIIWCLGCFVALFLPRFTTREDAEGTEKLVYTGVDLAAMASLLLLPLVF